MFYGNFQLDEIYIIFYPINSKYFMCDNHNQYERFRDLSAFLQHKMIEYHLNLQCVNYNEKKNPLAFPPSIYQNFVFQAYIDFTHYK